jgi:hypothetical protein
MTKKITCNYYYQTMAQVVCGGALGDFKVGFSKIDPCMHNKQVFPK